MLRIVTMLVVLTIGASQALAQGSATVQVTSARVFINDVAVSGSVTANPGTKVRAGEAGYATIYYKNGCSEVVEADQTRIVQDDPVCDQGAYYDYDKKTALIVGAVGFGGLLGLIYALDDDDERLSP